MKITQINKIYQLTFMPNFFPVNCYLVEEENGLILIDAALPYSYKKILEAAKEIGKDITKILLTHAHDDHVGALDALKKLMPNVPIYISARDARLLAGDSSLEPGEPNTPVRGGVPKNLISTADILLNHGDKVDSLIAVSLRGHTPGSMGFFDTRSSAIIVGDALQTRGGIAVAGQYRITFPFPAMATWNKELALESAKKIMEYSPALLATGHGVMIKQPVDKIRKAIETAERNLKNSKQGAEN